MTKIEKLRPTPTQRINCMKCGELMIKIYPNSSIHYTGNPQLCKLCRNKEIVLANKRVL